MSRKELEALVETMAKYMALQTNENGHCKVCGQAHKLITIHRN